MKIYHIKTDYNIHSNFAHNIIKLETDFVFLVSKISTDCECNNEIKRSLLLGRNAMTNLDMILNSRDITLLTKFRIVKTMAFPLVVYRCETWTTKKAEN